MSVKAVEASRTPVYATAGDAPSPVFQDGNISVYPIPLYSSMDEDSSGTPENRPLKRKRSLSPTIMSKRTPPETASTVGSMSSAVPSLANRAEMNDFSPLTLAGEDAQEWRKLILQEMFPKVVTQEQDRSPSKKTKNTAKEPLKDAPQATPSSSKGSSMGGDKKYAQLPRLASGSDSAGLPVLGYLIVGPTMRGKFDVKKAEALGLPRGPLRSRLTKGESVTFEVDDGNGGKIQRTVTPEDCIGPTEMPQVCRVTKFHRGC